MQKTFFMSIVIILIFSLGYLAIEMNQKISFINNLQQENAKLNASISHLQYKFDKLESLLNNISENKESQLRDPTWEELKTFLEVDKTNELRASDSFDCSGFAIELFKKARANGFRVAYVEVVFNENLSHALNAFQTDKGFVFVDNAGNENGNENDKIAYVQIGKPYGTIILSSVKDRRLNCDVTCSQFSRGLSYLYYSNLFDYNYFSEFKKCKTFYDECVASYNQAVEEYKRGSKSYTHSEIQTWYENLKTLGKELGDRYYFFSEWSNTVRSIEIYW